VVNVSTPPTPSGSIGADITLSEPVTRRINPTRMSPAKR
jgi:hypothetical protein